MPTQYTNVIIVQGNVETMVMRLPPKDTLQGSEDDLLNGWPYPIRPFYSDTLRRDPTMPTDPAGHHGTACEPDRRIHLEQLRLITSRTEA